MERQLTKRRRCAFESLETRQMMAGDVTARIVDGNLTIRGDRDANVIAVTQAGTTITVTGTNTTVNSDATPALLTGFTGSIKVRMRGGNDGVTLTGLTAPGLNARLGKGDDSLGIEHCTINGDTKLNGRRGNDTILVDTVVSTATHFNGLLDINLGEGRGNDTLHMVNVAVTGETEIRGHGGTDDVTIGDSTFTTLDTNLGRGDDSLTIEDETSVSVQTKLNGGRGTNTFDDDGSNTLTGLTQKNFV